MHTEAFKILFPGMARTNEQAGSRPVLHQWRVTGVRSGGSSAARRCVQGGEQVVPGWGRCAGPRRGQGGRRHLRVQVREVPVLVNSAVRKGVKLERKACWQALVAMVDLHAQRPGLLYLTAQAVACCAGRLSTLTIIVGCHRRPGRLRQPPL